MAPSDIEPEAPDRRVVWILLAGAGAYLAFLHGKIPMVPAPPDPAPKKKKKRRPWPFRDHETED